MAIRTVGGGRGLLAFAWIARSPGLATASVLGTTANGKLRNDHPYISAVAIVSQRDRAIDFYDDLVAGMDGVSADEKWRAINAAKDRGEVPEGHYHRLDLYRTRTMSAHAAALPGDLFNGPQDRLFDYDEEAGVYVWTGGPSPAR